MSKFFAVIEDVPGDGDCLFHAVGKSFQINGRELRKLTITYIKSFIHRKLHDQTIKSWIEMESSNSEHYLRKLENGMWGGGIELSIMSSMLNVPIIIYEKKMDKCIKMTEFFPDCTLPSLKIVPVKCVTILYLNKNHYAILKINKDL